MCVITWDEGQPDGVDIDGIRILTMCRVDSGIKGVRFFWPKWTSLCKAMERANADVYYYNCGDLGLGQVVMWCQQHERKSIYSVASDPACDPGLPLLKPLRERVLYKYGLRHVDSVVVQTCCQQRMLREGFGIDSTLIPMPCEGFRDHDDVVGESISKESMHVLWAGRISEEKRLEWLLDIAELCPQITFNVVGASNTDSNYASVLRKRAAGIPNVKMHGRVPHAQMYYYYLRSRVLCCTSVYEGFPNTFLEAWSCSIPVVSTIDPDGVIANYNLGWTASNVSELACALEESINNSEKWEAASNSARDYYFKNHTLDTCMEQFERVIRHVYGSQSLQEEEWKHER